MRSTKWPIAAQNDWHDVRASSCNASQLLLFLVIIIYLLTHAEIFVTVCAGSSLEVKIETDSNDAVGIKTEADSNEYARGHMSSTGRFGLC